METRRGEEPMPDEIDRAAAMLAEGARFATDELLRNLRDREQRFRGVPMFMRRRVAAAIENRALTWQRHPWRAHAAEIEHAERVASANRSRHLPEKTP